MAGRRSLIGTVILGLSLASIAPTWAVQPDEVLPDRAMERRARDLSATLRCMVCQNQSIDDSDAPLARDLRLLVRERLKAGDSNGEIVDYLVARYGQFVLLRPRFEPQTILLWGTPFLLLLGGASAIWFAKRSGGRKSETALTSAEEGELARVLSAGDADRTAKE